MYCAWKFQRGFVSKRCIIKKIGPQSFTKVLYIFWTTTPILLVQYWCLSGKEINGKFYTLKYLTSITLLFFKKHHTFLVLQVFSILTLVDYIDVSTHRPGTCKPKSIASVSKICFKNSSVTLPNKVWSYHHSYTLSRPCPAFYSSQIANTLLIFSLSVSANISSFWRLGKIFCGLLSSERLRCSWILPICCESWIS